MEQSEELKLMATRVSREAQGRKAKVGRLPGSALRPWPGFSQRFSLTPLSFDFVRASGSVAAHATVGLEMATRTGRQDTQHDCYLIFGQSELSSTDSTNLVVPSHDADRSLFDCHGSPSWRALTTTRTTRANRTGVTGFPSRPILVASSEPLDLAPSAGPGNTVDG